VKRKLERKRWKEAIVVYFLDNILVFAWTESGKPRDLSPGSPEQEAHIENVEILPIFVIL
jgi:hypothetical protein